MFGCVQEFWLSHKSKGGPVRVDVVGISNSVGILRGPFVNNFLNFHIYIVFICFRNEFLRIDMVRPDTNNLKGRDPQHQDRGLGQQSAFFCSDQRGGFGCSFFPTLSSILVIPLISFYGINSTGVKTPLHSVVFLYFFTHLVKIRLNQFVWMPRKSFSSSSDSEQVF